jgi:hypothetical protein
MQFFAILHRLPVRVELRKKGENFPICTTFWSIRLEWSEKPSHASVPLREVTLEVISSKK